FWRTDRSWRPRSTRRSARCCRSGCRPTAMTPSPPEVWLRGPVPGVCAELMPVVYSLLQVREEIVSIGATVQGELFWENPGGAASIGFHLLHLAGSLDRLLTYARGEQ